MVDSGIINRAVVKNLYKIFYLKFKDIYYVLYMPVRILFQRAEQEKTKQQFYVGLMSKISKH